MKPIEVQSLYSDQYSQIYNNLYLTPYEEKHRENNQILQELFDKLSNDGSGIVRWLDVCCGQAPQFRHFAKRQIEMVGLDISSSQIAMAKENCPQAKFIVSNALDAELPKKKFDLTTLFWAAYGYLENLEEIELLVKKMVEWTRSYIYIEILRVETLKMYNVSWLSNDFGSKVTEISDNNHHWRYKDDAGEHVMYTPDVSIFLELFEKYSARPVKVQTGMLFHHVVFKV